MARANWDTGYFQAEIYYQLLTELGYDVVHPEENELGAELFYVAVSERDVDFWPNGWFPLHSEFLEAAPNAVRVGNSIAAGGFQGYLVDKATADEHGIESIEQIADDPDLVALFDTDGNGLADLTGCDAGWGCHEQIEQHLGSEGLGDSIEHINAQYSVLMADVLARHDRGEPVLFYTGPPTGRWGHWRPEKMWFGSPLQLIPTGTHRFQASRAVSPIRVTSAGRPTTSMSWPTLTSWPTTQRPATLLEVIELPLGDVSAQNFLMDQGENTQADITRHAEEWIAENRDLVDTWLQAARDAA
jgi:glycine betaine/proline transport system substrate-binding protein